MILNRFVIANAFLIFCYVFNSTLTLVHGETNETKPECDGHIDRMQESFRFGDYQSRHETCKHAKVVEVLSVDGRNLSYTPNHGKDGTGITLEVDTINAGYHVICAAVNYLYSKKHGYNYRYIHLNLYSPPWKNLVSEKVLNGNRSQGSNKHSKEKMQYCLHPLHGKRSAPWCKLLGIFERVKHRTADEVLFLDTDAFVMDHEKTLDVAYEAGATMDSASPEKASFMVATHKPYFQIMARSLKSLGIERTPMVPACTAVMVFKPSAMSDHILNMWWNGADFPQWNFDFPFEQGALEYGLLRHNSLRQNHISVIDWLILSPKGPDFIPLNADTAFICHVGSGGYNSRTRKFAPLKKLKALGVTNSKQFQLLVEEIEKNSMLVPSIERLEYQMGIEMPGITVQTPIDCCIHTQKVRAYYCPDVVCDSRPDIRP